MFIYIFLLGWTAVLNIYNLIHLIKADWKSLTHSEIVLMA